MENFYTSGELAEELAKDEIYTVGTIKSDAKGFPAQLKNLTLSRGEYVSFKSGDIVYYAFHDCKVIRFLSNVFPETMPNQVPRVQPDGTFRYQAVPPLLPAYNKYMGGVDLTDQLRKTYCFDRKSKRSWIRLFYCFFDLAINNAFILHKSSNEKKGLVSFRSVDFRLKLAHELLDSCQVRRKRKNRGIDHLNWVPSIVCQIRKAEDIGLKRGRCVHCLQTKPKCERGYTSFACSCCRVVFVGQDASRTTTGLVNEESSQEECFRGHVELQVSKIHVKQHQYDLVGHWKECEPA